MNTSVANQDRFRQHAFRAVLSLLDRASNASGGIEPLLDAHPFLSAYLDEAVGAGLDGLTLAQSLERWDAMLADGAAIHPIDRVVRATGLAPDGISGWLWCGLRREDPRFGAIVDRLLGRDGQPTRATLSGWIDDARPAGWLLTEGWLEESESSGSDPTLSVPQGLWDAVCGRIPSIPGFVHSAMSGAEPDPVFPPEVWEQTGPPASGRNPTWILRGTRSSGRRTLARWIARREGLGTLEVPAASASKRWIAPLAVLLDAIPVVDIETTPSEPIEWNPPSGTATPWILRVGGAGSVRVDHRARRVELHLPSRLERHAHWCRALGGSEPAPGLLEHRLARGAIHSCVRDTPPDARNLDTFRREIDTRAAHLLEGIARRLPPPHPDESLELSVDARKEFDALVSRCRFREQLAESLPSSFGHGGTGVRALFKGPSGTGKTLGARHLAAAIHRPIHRLDLSMVVSKWLGETEKNLEKAFQGAESMDAVLLLDEADALLAPRTGVGSSNDRYANLETNYLLQRMESFDGILVATTNASERIEQAFLRRFDAVVDFPQPDPATRLALWKRHLPSDHGIGRARLEEIALKCAFSGGLIRNAALHAALLAMEVDAPVTDAHLLESLRREYRRTASVCPSLAEAPG